MFSWYKYLIVSLVFSHLGFWSGNLFLIAPFPDFRLLVPSILHFPFSGHDAIRKDIIDILQCKRGSGIWKMNNTIRESREKLWPIWSNVINSNQNPMT